MKYYSEFKIEFKSGLIFSVVAFVLSIVAGLTGSVPPGMIIFRSLIVIPLFFLVGFGVFVIIKNFVPELYEMVLNLNETVEEDSSVENADISNNPEEAVSEYSEDRENFSEFTEDDYTKIDGISSSNAFDTSGGRLGKHIVVDKQANSFGYEPKIMAEAIRTMMSKDKD